LSRADKTMSFLSDIVNSYQIVSSSGSVSYGTENKGIAMSEVKHASHRW
jgi:hypothetical protein